MAKTELGGFSNEALDAFLDAPLDCQAVESPTETGMLYDRLLGFGVPKKDARHVLEMSLPRSLTPDAVFNRVDDDEQYPES